MSQQDDRPGDAPTEWLSPALYRQLCDAVDAALSAPPDARDGILAARLGSDQRLLAEARALLASHESSPHTFITPAAGSGFGFGSDETIVGRPDSATMIRRDSATVITANSGARRAYDTDGTQEMAAMPRPAGSGTVTLRTPPPEPPSSGQAPTVPGVPVAAPAAEPLAPVSPTASRAVWGAAPPVSVPPPPLNDGPPPLVAPLPPPAPARPAAAAPISAPVAVAPAAPAPVRGSDVGEPIPTRRTGTSAGTIVAFGLAGVAVLALAVVLWLWYGANTARRAAELRLAQAEARFGEVRQLGQRLAEVDRLLAVTPDTGAQAARAVLLRTWLQYLTDLQRASGGTDRELLFEVSKGYRQLAAAQGGISGRTLGDRTAAVRTLQIGERLLVYLDKTTSRPDPAILGELVATHVDLGDLYAVGKDASASSEQYRRALAATERMAAAGAAATDVKRQTDSIRQRIQSGPPAPVAPVVDAEPITSSGQP